MNINYNIINDNLIQIYGDVNGWAYKLDGDGCKYWCFSISFFQNNKLIKISTSEKNQTMHTLSNLKEKLNKVIEEKY